MPKFMSPVEFPEDYFTSLGPPPTADELEFYDAENRKGEESRLLDPFYGWYSDKSEDLAVPHQTWMDAFLNYWQNFREENDGEEKESDEEYEVSEVEFFDEIEDDSCTRYVWKYREYPAGGGKTKPGEAARPRNVWRITRISQRKKCQIFSNHEDPQQQEVLPTTQSKIAIATKASTDSLCSRTPVMPGSKRSIAAHRDYDDDMFQESSMAETISKMKSHVREIRRAAVSANAHRSFIAHAKRRHSDIGVEDEAYLADDELSRPAKRSKTGNNSERAANKEIQPKADYGAQGSASPVKNRSKDKQTNSVQGYSTTANAIEKEPGNVMPKRKKNGAWTNREHDAIYELLQAQRQQELDNPEAKKLKDEKLFNAISNRLRAMGVDRSPNAAKNYWNRYGRARSGFDERIGAKINRSLTTSAQGIKAQARKIHGRET